jgi:low affinity Fe/Cu permease
MRGLFARRRTQNRHQDGGEPTRSLPSRTLYRLGHFSAHAGAGLFAAAFVVGWIAFGIATGFPSWWETILYSATSSITLIMVFTLQHTQSRLESATHRKLDELLRSLPPADDRLIAVEQASDAELAALAELNSADRARASQAGAS